ncbi:fumarate hydratase [Paramaledivibacter caminithermalis]|jgi:fumarate hydratase subunit alpha|uniref:Fumarate hydratase subunit alpha n=1 Tax=Paramaledivibacter caminithermalis (strain DSM 15212 / CIP 107654 / DViRD3) TaxID=1121301 RepID=A0A1M6QZ32_PARC5|nr:fumarate hydratase [Paramaledivibacter caminithermalis]SHK25413.1 fumarate hydratase subunit alpha [Paramaledivibacter caminithermalis DSM 15212]
MRKLHVKEITQAVKEMCISANYNLGKDVIDAFEKAKENEESPVGKEIIENLIKNAQIARYNQMPMCQDTGMAVLFVELGQEVQLLDGNITDAINEGVRQGYSEGYLRKSVVSDPLIRKNTGDNTPAIIYYDIVPGDKVKITIAPKGFGSENMSKTKMLKPSDGIKGVEDFVVEVVSQAGPNPCPPIVVGVGIGGTLDKAANMAKKALIRPIGEHNELQHINEMEKRLLERINNLGIGPQGLGGITTALAVNIEVFATHIAGLPVAVNINCHASRHEERII